MIIAKTIPKITNYILLSLSLSLSLTNDIIIFLSLGA